MRTTLIFLASIASSMAQDNPENKPSSTGPFYTTATLADGVVTTIKMPYSDGFYTATGTAVPTTPAGPFYTTATLADGVVTTIKMPYSDGFYTATGTGVFTTPAGPFYTTATLADGVVTTIKMPYSDGFYTATGTGVFTTPVAAAVSGDSTKTPPTTTGAPVSEFTGAAATLCAGGLLQGGAAAALGAVAYLL